MGKTNAKANRNKNTRGDQAHAAGQPGAALSAAHGGCVGITLPKGSYTIDENGNLTIHGGGGLPGGRAGGMSYEEFMENVDGGGSEGGLKDGGGPLGMGVPTLGADPEELIRKCTGTVYGYARCSTAHQDYQRQVDAFRKLGIRDENIYKDKKSGKDFNREEFQRLMQVLQPGDCIVVVELDRFGRSIVEIKNHWLWITQQRQADIIVLDQPILNTGLGRGVLGAFLADVILAVFSFMAEVERELINKRMEEGIRLARLAGTKLGRRLLEIPQLFWKLKERFLGGQISQNKASQNLGVDPKTFRSWLRRTGDISDAQEWESLKAGIEEQEREERIRQARIRYGEVAEPVGAKKAQDGKAGQGTGAAQDTEAAQEPEVTQDTEVAQDTEAAQDAGAAQGTEAAQERKAEQDGKAEQDTEAAQNTEVTQDAGAAQNTEVMQDAGAAQEPGATQKPETARGMAVGQEARAENFDVAGNPLQTEARAGKKARRSHQKPRHKKQPGDAKKKAVPKRSSRPKRCQI